jgi:hypothetical protein
MRHAAILDVLRAVSEAAAAHPEIAVWWYAPERRLRLAGERSAGKRGAPLQIIVEPSPGEVVDCAAIAAVLGRCLPEQHVEVRPRAATEEAHLYRLKSRSEAA